MLKQTGDLVTDRKGVAQSGLIIRHLVLPENLAGSEEVMKFISSEISIDSYVNVMDQYHPEYKARDFPALERRITSQEYNDALNMAKKYGLHRLDGDI
jgi:putative pyruvate formate lyase activating enzyme